MCEKIAEKIMTPALADIELRLLTLQLRSQSSDDVRACEGLQQGIEPARR
jgi:hypothetical protein